MVIETKKLQRTYLRQRKDANYFYAVHETDLTLAPGQVTALMGRSGSGKTTLLHMLAGLLTPSAGQVLYEGTDLYALTERELARYRNTHIGMIPQGRAASESLTVLENVLLPAGLYGTVSQAHRERAQRWMRRLGIEELALVYPQELSGGEMRRLAIARALINDPEVILADEPTGDLDDENTRIVLEVFQELARTGKTVFLVTHETMATSFADRLLTMNAGLLKESQTSTNE